MKRKDPHPRAPAHPPWAILAILFVATTISATLVREGSAVYQRQLLEKAGWEVHDLRLVPGIKDDIPQHSPHISGLALTDKDTLWMGTGYSLVSFDGAHWTVFPDDAEDVAIDGQQNIWVSGSAGLRLLDHGEARWIAETEANTVLCTGPQARVWVVEYEFLRTIVDADISLVWPDGSRASVPEPVDGKRSSFVACDPRGSIWTDDRRSGKWYVYNGQAWKPRAGPYDRPGLQINAIAFDADGDPWVATPDFLAYQRGGNWERLEIAFTGGGISSMAFDRLGTLWIAYASRNWTDTEVGLASYRDSRWTIYQIEDIKDPLLDIRRGEAPTVHELVIDSANRPWFAMDYYLVRMNTDSPSFSADPMPAGLALARVVSNWAAWGSGWCACAIAVLAIRSVLIRKEASTTKRSRTSAVNTVRVLLPGIALALLSVGSLVLFSDGVPARGADGLGVMILWLIGLPLAAGALCGGILFLGALGRHSPSLALRILGWLASILGVLSLLALALFALLMTSYTANPW